MLSDGFKVRMTITYKVGVSYICFMCVVTFNNVMNVVLKHRETNSSLSREGFYGDTCTWTTIDEREKKLLCGEHHTF